MKTEEIITSPQNAQIQLLKKLALKKYRYQENIFIVENLAIIYDALNSGFDFESLFVTKEFITKNKDKFDAILKVTQVSKYYLIDERLNKQYSQLNTPSGISAVYKIKVSKLDKGESVVYLNGVSDPGNLGTITRACLAFGFKNLILDEACADIYNAKTISAAKDSIFKVNITEDRDFNWLQKNKNKLPIYITSSHQGENLKSFKADQQFCLVLGSESHGVSDSIIKLSKKSLKIEMSEDIESLNVASAASILLYSLSSIKKSK